jgi:diguanylate cyclase (GGDEF)-like protein
MIVKNRTKIFDLGFILAALTVAVLFILEIGIFASEGRVSQAELTLELNELLVATTLTMLALLAYTWRRASEHKKENARRIEAEKEILSLAMQDPLTGLPNRRQFDEALKTALQSAPVAPEAHAVLMLDLNGFKRINDLHGHPVGDEVLIHVGSRLMRAVRDGDLVARLGGDEFAVLARNVSGPEGATTIALRIIEGLSSPVSAGGGRHNVGTAIGIALSPQDGQTPEDILRKADVALYRAKAERASSLRFFEPDMDARLREREVLETALRESVTDDDIALSFKPSVDGRTGKIVAFEAVARWQHPVVGEVTPDRFIPIAEDAGLVAVLTDQLLRKACLAAADWPAPVRLAFGVTASQLKEPTFGLRLLAVLAATHMPPHRLDLEVDEGALIRDTEATQAILEPLRAAGVSVVAKHFGTGYSDLQNLHRLRLDRIKIDATFIGAMSHDRKAATMVKALIGVGKGMDIAVSADGVMDEAQRAALAEQGCHEIQGQQYGAPVDADGALGLVSGQPGPRRRAARQS